MVRLNRPRAVLLHTPNNLGIDHELLQNALARIAQGHKRIPRYPCFPASTSGGHHRLDNAPDWRAHQKTRGRLLRAVDLSLCPRLLRPHGLLARHRLGSVSLDGKSGLLPACFSFCSCHAVLEVRAVVPRVQSVGYSRIPRFALNKAQTQSPRTPNGPIRDSHPSSTAVADSLSGPMYAGLKLCCAARLGSGAGLRPSASLS